MGFRDLIVQIAPPFLKRKWGERFLYTFGLIADGVMAWSYDGVRARFPSFAPDDEALAAIGRDRTIQRGFAESQASYALRERRWLDAHVVQGNPFELMRQVRGYLSPFDVRCRTVDARGTWCKIDVGGAESIDPVRGNWDWDGIPLANAWGKWWLIIYPSTSGLWTDEGVWGTGDGIEWEDGPGTWGTSATDAQVHAIRELCRQWNTEGTTCMGIIIAFDDASFDPSSALHAPGMPDGTWAVGSAYDGGGVRRATRLATARYWDGTGNPTPFVGG